MNYRLLDRFRALFEGHRYLHRNSTLGDSVAIELYEDLLNLGKSEIYVARVRGQERVLNRANRRRGISARRGDSTFGELVPGTTPFKEAGFDVSRGQVATVEIGSEVKILAKAMIKQIDRVIENLERQVDQFHKGGGQPLCVALVGINHARICTGYEGERVHITDGKAHKHPIQECQEAERRILEAVKQRYDESIILRYRATNAEPFEFEWVDEKETQLDYGALLTRLSRRYEQRFGPSQIAADRR